MTQWTFFDYHPSFINRNRHHMLRAFGTWWVYLTGIGEGTKMSIAPLLRKDEQESSAQQWQWRIEWARGCGGLETLKQDLSNDSQGICRQNLSRLIYIYFLSWQRGEPWQTVCWWLKPSERTVGSQCCRQTQFLQVRQLINLFIFSFASF